MKVAERNRRAARLRRREVLQLLLGAPLAASALSCDRHTAPRSYAGELLGQNAQAGHRLRGALPRPDEFPKQPTHTAAVVIVGAGPAGLSAGYALAQQNIDDFCLLDLEACAGGTSRAGTSAVTPYPWAAHYITCPTADNGPLCTLLKEMGVITVDAAGEPRGLDPYLVSEPKERHFYRGFFYPGLYRYAGASADDLDQLKRFQAEVVDLSQQRDTRGRRAFALPFSQSSNDERWAALDRVSAADFLRRKGYTSERLRWLADYACRDDFGLTLADTSAWALLHYFAARSDGERPHVGDVLTWPQGNAALTAHLQRSYRRPVQGDTLVVDVAQDASGVSVYAIDVRSQRLLHYRARRVILATPQFIVQRLVRELRQQTEQGPPAYGAWWVANLHLRQRPQQRGAEQAWDTVLTESPSLGYVCATHQRGRGFGPTVLTYYMPMTDSDPAAGRQRLFGLGLNELQDVVLSDLVHAHPDLRSHVERIDVFRWGHAMVQPRVGRLFAAAQTTAKSVRGRLHFAHSDLSGLALFEEAFDHGLRAAAEVIAELRAEPV